ncbi:MAG: alpha/beta fold hydrolase [Actinobacteria bacterium]|nr:alpha/beta fold hydrolase [Actinomycetota bacterium]
MKLALAVVVVLAIAAAACDNARPARRTAGPVPTGRPPATTLPPSSTSTSTTLAPPAPLVWTRCGGFECATLTVPLDYAQPHGATVGIALIRSRATDPAHRIGSLVVNPGGPGESGIALIGRDVSLMPAGVRQRFDIVEFDPRGVGRSGAISCTTGGAAAETGLGPDPAPSTPAAVSAVVQSNTAYAQACAHAAGALLAHVGSVDVARDLDQLRRALGDQGLTYLGLSYGTLLGATYADLFPTHVRALALDGAIDPALPMNQLQVDQARSFEDALDAFFAACVPGCGWRPNGDPATALNALFDRLRAHPLPAGGGEQAGPAELYSALLSRLYTPTRRASLASALAAAERGDGSAIRSLADTYDGRAPGATINADASNAVNCLDHPVPRDIGQLEAEANAARARAPVFGPILVWGGVVCAVWPVPATRAVHPVHAHGAPPIVVVGTTGDPATPYSWAAALASELDQGVLLTRRGDSHVAFFSSSCVRAALETYFVDRAPPPPGTSCQ